MVQDEVLLRGKWSSQEEPNVGDDKADIFEGSWQKSSCFDDATKVSGDKVHDHVDNSKVSKGYGQKSVKKAKVKREYTSFKVVTVNLDGYRYESTEFVPTPVTSEPIKAATSEPIPTTRNEPIQVYCNSLGVDAMKLYMTLSRVDCPYRYAISFTVISFIYLI